MVERRNTTLLSALALAVLVALAGCTGGGSPYGESPSPENVEQQHASALREAGSFTYSSHVSADAAVVDLSTNVTAAIELDPNTRLVRVNSSEESSVLYVPPSGQPYSRSIEGNTIEYERVSNESVRNVSRYVHPPLANITRSYDFARAGTTTVAGQKTWVYRANATTMNESTAGPLAETISELENVNTTIRLFVRSDGLVKRMSYHVDATVVDEEVSLTYRVTYTDVGSTDVTAPSWLDQAKSVADS